MSTIIRLGIFEHMWRFVGTFFQCQKCGQIDRGTAPVAFGCALSDDTYLEFGSGVKPYTEVS